MTWRQSMARWLDPPAPQPTVAEVQTQMGRCVSCVFWLQVDKTHGECHAVPSQVFDRSTLNRPVLVWGLTAARDWCGAYRRV